MIDPFADVVNLHLPPAICRPGTPPGAETSASMSTFGRKRCAPAPPAMHTSSACNGRACRCAPVPPYPIRLLWWLPAAQQLGI